MSTTSPVNITKEKGSSVIHLNSSSFRLSGSSAREVSLTLDVRETKKLIKDLQVALVDMTTRVDSAGNLLEMVELIDDFLSFKKGETFFIYPYPIHTDTGIPTYACFGLENVSVIPASYFTFIN